MRVGLTGGVASGKSTVSAMLSELGAVVVDAAGEPAGQVTSSRYSPVLKQVIGMAWVPSALAGDGATIRISDEGDTLIGRLQTKPFYDPDGEVLRS